MWFFIVFVIASNRTGQCGQIIFCPNMGRFGNQLDHYTSMLHLSKLVNRKLILSPLIDYSNGFNPIEFTKIFNITILRKASILIICSVVATLLHEAVRRFSNHHPENLGDEI